MINLSRRGFIFGGAAFAIVPVGILMPIKQLLLPEDFAGMWIDEFTDPPLPLPAGKYNMQIKGWKREGRHYVMTMMRF